ncbi:acyl carrier protein [Chlorogloeopsis sp. ULAP01]|uniref:acyl carrier protein n=1 Tax=Chlorogloeopsis sp. ULAP01 TaxID=3056483 RepID=UPI0025AADFCC|nr:acyl carrier protein [Chlorogloeopsis sp. ULAP01]MDM9383458.1 acyl carrier protein [Chlorogloeopsis sp. ULAP01]
MIEQTLENQTSPVQMTAEDMQDWLASQIAEQLGIEPDEIDIKVPFDSYGLDSVQIVSIANLGKQYFGLQLSPLLLWNYPNIESLSEYLVEELKIAKLEVFEI